MRNSFHWGDIQLSKHKHFEWQFETKDYFADKFACKLRLKRKTHHGGVFFELCIPKLFWMEVNVHDNRHWNDETNDWETYK